ncbi:MAG: triose-phosphate isomerase [Candidatus Gracilibacteria bacterium]
MNFPIIITNFKTYEEGTGAKALELAKAHAKVATETGVSFGIVVQPTDLAMLSASISLPVFAQHIDPIGFGAGTGLILPDAVKGCGAYGTIINHSERRVSMEHIKTAVEIAKKLNLFTIVCAVDDKEASEIAKFGPDLIAVEPPELIGGDVSVSKANPDLIRRSVEAVGKGKLLVGAGVKTGEDVRIAIELGAVGVLLASGVVKAKDPEGVLRELVEGLRKGR